jgi:hypothetical protein
VSRSRYSRRVAGSGSAAYSSASASRSRSNAARASYRRPLAASAVISVRYAPSWNGSAAVTAPTTSTTWVCSPKRDSTSAYSTSKPEMAFAEGLTWPLGPFLEPVLGQQVASVQRGDRPVTRRVPGPPRPQAGGVEGVRVEPRHGAL